MSASLPAALTLAWDREHDLGLVDLVFDTGLHRLLTLSHNDAAMRRQVWGPQPECVRDYRIEVRRGASWHEIESVTGNILRLRRHALAIRADALRLTITATHGLDHARVCAVRVLPAGAGPWIDG
jgi:hypothetical protein